MLGDCIPWPGRTNAAGYGTLGKKFAHRLMWEKVYGRIPDGMVIDHLCRWPTCINPRHLRCVPQSVNLENRRPPEEWRKPGLKTHCKNGHEFDEENTAYRPEGGRRCRKCSVVTTQRHRVKKKENYT